MLSTLNSNVNYWSSLHSAILGSNKKPFLVEEKRLAQRKNSGTESCNLSAKLHHPLLLSWHLCGLGGQEGSVKTQGLWENHGEYPGQENAKEESSEAELRETLMWFCGKFESGSNPSRGPLFERKQTWIRWGQIIEGLPVQVRDWHVSTFLSKKVIINHSWHSFLLCKAPATDKL